MVIDIINVLGVALDETENDPPVSPNGHGPKTLHLAFELVQPKTRHVHMGNSWGGVKRCQTPDCESYGAATFGVDLVR